MEEEIELYLLDRNRFDDIKPTCEDHYLNLSMCREGRLILEYFGVEPLPLPPEGWTFSIGKTIQFVHSSKVMTAELWERDDLTKLGEQAEEMAKAASAPPSSVPPLRRPTPPQEVLEFYERQRAKVIDAQRQATTRKKEEWFNHLRVLKLRWDAGRAARGIDPRA